MVSKRLEATFTTDPRDQPSYPLTEAARYIKVPVATLRAWVVGRPYPRAGGAARSQPLIHPPTRKPPVLSFWNLVEAHVLRSLRIDHGVSLSKLRQAIRYAEKSMQIERLLLDEQLCTDAGQVFLARYGELISLSASGQLAMRKVFEAHLRRVEWDKWKFPVRLFPFVSSEDTAATRPIAIDPELAFGRPMVRSQGVSTAVIADRIDAGETVTELATDYRLTEAEVEQAVLYERAA
jgi:uncharacterized protein (DUF433 family)